MAARHLPGRNLGKSLGLIYEWGRPIGEVAAIYSLLFVPKDDEGEALGVFVDFVEAERALRARKERQRSAACLRRFGGITTKRGWVYVAKNAGGKTLGQFTKEATALGAVRAQAAKGAA
jgi:hypothetical protein